jgi:hypothetical protein
MSRNVPGRFLPARVPFTSNRLVFDLLLLPTSPTVISRVKGYTSGKLISYMILDTIMFQAHQAVLHHHNNKKKHYNLNS